MQNIIYKGAINSLSFGNVSLNLLREMFKKNMNVTFFPIGEKLDFEAFDKVDPNLRNWIINSAQNRFNTVSKDYPSLSQWHISGSENRVSPSQTLFTFYEVDQPTHVERSIVNLQNNTCFASKHAADVFKKSGCENVHHVPIGFDTDFYRTEKSYLEDTIHFGLMGKFEKRKNTHFILQNWAKKYGNNYKYQLSCCVTNPFFKPEDMDKVINSIFDGKKYGNINFLPRLKTNSEVNDYLNSIDIDLSGLSGAEGWNLPAFNSTALGKWSIVMNHTSHKDWATSKNSILINPDSVQEIYDNTFFQKGAPFNQGNYNCISEDTIMSAFEKSEKKYGKINSEGLKLQSKFTYEKTLNSIIKIIENEK
jgi:hypothetical protein